MKICHISTAHPRYDTRIFYKECVSLSEHYENVYLIVADGFGDEIKNKIHILDIGKPKGRQQRFLKFGKIALKKAIDIKADIYHFHDPELLRIAKKLLKTNAKVIYDAHEDLPRQILNKTYIPKILRKTISKFVENYENKISKKLSGIIVATPHIRDRFLKINKNTIDINNFPKLEDINFYADWDNREFDLAYIGGIFKTRGIMETLEAIEGTNISLILAGNFSPAELEKECKQHPAWKNVDYRGFVDRKEVNEILSRVKAGMVILEATPSYIVSLPVKMFEYMAAGLPVIASDFPLWKTIVQKNNCGICIGQTKPKEIKENITNLLSDKETLKIMGKNGRKAVETEFNWQSQEEKLIEFYKNIVK